jgi:phage terminase large subunit GpA-like protein
LKRLSTYADSKALFASTPTVSGGSRIERLFQESSMGRWFLKCPGPECDGWQELQWEDLDFNTVWGVFDLADRCKLHLKPWRRTIRN